MSLQKKKRNRVPLSCTICRKRKVKCDKTKPHCNQCTKTGVAHLCHYMDQTWAEEAEKELTKESELKLLRERVKSLEEMLSNIHSTSSINNSTPISNQASPKIIPESSSDDRYKNDELDLTKQFDMLHLKNNGTIHLGTTHWLAIMRGDPYLKLLWGHIFTLREKLFEWHSQRKNMQSDNSTTGLCPVIQKSNDSKCPVVSNVNDMSRCPVIHESLSNTAVNDKSSNGERTQCPISNKVVNKLSNNDSEFNKSNSIAFSSTHVLPSFQDLTSKCPIIHESSSSPSVSSSKSLISLQNFKLDTVITRLSQILPPKKIVILFLDKFFKYLYPTIPIIDELSFKSQINQIIQISDESNSLKLVKPSDCCLLGILIIIIRLTWLSLPSNACNVELSPEYANFYVPHLTSSTSVQSKEEAFLLNYETPSEAIDLVKTYLIKFDEISCFSNDNVNMTTVQFAIFYKLYLTCCGNCTLNSTSTVQDNESHQVLLSIIVRMAFSCGLYRDPDNFPQLNNYSSGEKMNKDSVSNIEKLKHTWRKTWYFIVSLDVQQSLSLGTPRLLRNLNDFSDTKLPCVSKIDYVKDIKELIVVKNFTLFFQIDLCIISVLNHILNVSLAKTVRKFELDKLIQLLEDLCSGTANINDILNQLVNKGLLFTTEGVYEYSTDEVYTLPTLNQILTSPQSSINDTDNDKRLCLPYELTTKALFFSKHITLRMLLYLLNYILFTHYEPKTNEDPGTRILAKNYAQSALNYAMNIYRNSILFFNNTKPIGSGFRSIFNYMEVVLTPICLDVSHRALQFMVCLILRAKCGPLVGIGEASIIINNTQNNGVDKHIGKKENIIQNTSNIGQDINLDTSEFLADILMNHMFFFHKIVKQISVKYEYANKIARSAGFFITLLKKPSTMKLDRQSQKQISHSPHPTISNMASFFRNIPSLVLSANGDQLKRCPVYQDVIGFLPSKVSMGTTNPTSRNLDAQNLISLQQQTPSSGTYQPITYKGIDSHKTSNIRESNIKRRKLVNDPNTIENKNNVDDLPLSELFQIPQSSFLQQEPTTLYPLSPIKKINETINPSCQIPSSSNSVINSVLLNSGSETSLNETYALDFENFLIQNSNINGLVINPTSIIEAVGFNDDTQNNGLGIDMDLLPIEQMEIDGLNSLSQGNEFSIWE